MPGKKETFDVKQNYEHFIFKNTVCVILQIFNFNFGNLIQLIIMTKQFYKLLQHSGI